MQLTKNLHSEPAKPPVQIGESVENYTQAKLPKLHIKRFEGTYEDWPRFWNSFVEIIDKASMPGVTKFAYLKSYLDHKVKLSIDGLPFTNEGYNRAKSILEDKYGKDSEVVKAYTKQIFDLPTISNSNTRRIHEFSDKLTFCVQSLQTLGKLDQVNGYLSMTLDKLPGISGDLVRTDPTWESWNFEKLREALRLWTRRNPIEHQAPNKIANHQKSDKLYNAQQKNATRFSCVYCSDTSSHKSANCPKVVSVVERRKILQQKHLCFNCTGSSHRASDCKSKLTCQNCNKKHHTSICDTNTEQRSESMMVAQQDKKTVYPIFVVEVDGIKTRALLDTGSGSSYASAKLINALHKKPKEIKMKHIEMMLGSVTTKVEIFDVNVQSLKGDYSIDINVSKVDKPELMTLQNPRYKDLKQRYPHLNGVELNDSDTKAQLPVHLVLGASEYAKIKTKTAPKIGFVGEPVAEKTKFGWTIISSGCESDLNPMLFTQSCSTDYEQLCRLDVLGLKDCSADDQSVVYNEFKEQLTRHPEGYYRAANKCRSSVIDRPYSLL